MLRYTIGATHCVYDVSNEDDAVKLLERFVNRDDCFAIQQPDGTYRPVKRQLTRDDLLAHLRGEITIGVYQLKNGMVKWACFDIDAHDVGTDIFARSKLYTLSTKMSQIGIPHVIETSGTPSSFHVWLFFDGLTDVASAHYFCHDLKGEDISCEVYPKQRENDPAKPYGNLVKLPLGKNLKNDIWSQFVPSQLVLVRTVDISSYRVPRLARELADLIPSEPGTKAQTPPNGAGLSHSPRSSGSMPMNMRPCLKRALDTGMQLTGAEGHAMRISIVPELRIVRGLGLDDVTSMFAAQGDYNYSRTRDQVKSVWDYNRVSCSWLRKNAGAYVTDMCDSGCVFRRLAR